MKLDTELDTEQSPHPPSLGVHPGFVCFIPKSYVTGKNGSRIFYLVDDE